MIKKPKEKRAGCETCRFRVGEPYTDDTPDKVERVYCKARHTYVDVETMNRFCDHYSVDPGEMA